MKCSLYMKYECTVRLYRELTYSSTLEFLIRCMSVKIFLNMLCIVLVNFVYLSSFQLIYILFEFQSNQRNMSNSRLDQIKPLSSIGRSLSSSSSLTSLCTDISPSSSHFFEVIFIFYYFNN